MAKLYGIHEIELKPGVTPEEFEKFMKNEFTAYVQFPGWIAPILKGVRGIRNGRHLVLINVEDEPTRDRYFDSDGSMSQEGKQHIERYPGNTKLMETFLSLCNFGDKNWTDYVEIQMIQKQPKGKFFGVHQVELKSGVTSAEFETFLKTVMPGPTITNRVLKGVRGERNGKYLILAEAGTMEDRDQWFDDDELNEAGIQWFEDHPDVAQWFEKLDTLCSGFGGVFTDYVEF